MSLDRFVGSDMKLSTYTVSGNNGPLNMLKELYE